MLSESLVPEAYSRFERLLDGWTIDRIDVLSCEPIRQTIFDAAYLTICSIGTGEGRFELDFGGEARFRADFSSRQMTFAQAPGARADLVDHFLGNQVIPRILGHEGQMVVHAAAVDDGARSLLFVGPTGVGKSTLAASFYSAGFDLIGDDAIKIVRRGNRMEIEAVYQSLRLYPDSLHHVLPSGEQWEPVIAGSDKQKVPVLSRPVDREPRPVDAIFFLEAAMGPAPVARRVNPAQACASLIENGFWLDSADMERLKQRISDAGALTGAVRCYSLSFPRDYAALPAVREAIIELAA